MRYFAAILYMLDESINQKYRPQHLAYLENLEKGGKIHIRGPLAGGAGGLVIYKADSFEEAKEVAENDPYIIHGVRRLELHEWLID
ncbi:hypothetical protein BEP19_15235 [Ammoniphilus oxalaticus]|uniref:YCII-related domain-containing protein n=1 Tax=Ammoniphilus oxalaticus TaxID=66863 RepID=A0A419SD38_9BACL|nr:YciI family protein [Ammoniphilus oxalaticus]RKD21032.1 hypothetical protein BEP19_15235 [Ammoniphilus oxalaticus]